MHTGPEKVQKEATKVSSEATKVPSEVATQIVAAARKLGSLPEVGFRKWYEVISDRVFGPEVPYILDRTFLNCRIVGGVGLGKNPAKARISISSVVRANREVLELMPFFFSASNQLPGLSLEDLDHSHLMRWMWLINGRSGTTLLDLNPATSKNQYKGDPLSKALGKTKWDYPNDEQDKNWVVIVTGGVFRTAGHSPMDRLDMTIIKPPKRSIEREVL